MHLHERGYSVAAIVKRLEKEHTIVSLVQAAEKVQGKRKRRRPCKAATINEARTRTSCFYRQCHGSKRRAFIATTTTAFRGLMAGAASQCFL